jgi:prepilin-type N-terminal cleavage/methylation domain-containing protein
MKSHPTHRSPGYLPARINPQKRGFTIVELLVAITILAVLAALAVSVTGSARRSAIKLTDMNNLRSLATAAMASGTDHAGRFPNLHSASNSAPYYLRDRETLESHGIYKENCYINNPKIEGGAPKYTFWYMFPTQTPVHYCYFANDAPAGTMAWFQRGSVQPPSRAEYRGSIPYDEIIRDPSRAFARNAMDDAWYPVLWAGLCRDWPGKPQLAAVMKDGQALGVNVMYIDGSARWVDKKEMKVRYTASGGLKVYW